MNVTDTPTIDYRGAFSHKRMQLRPTLPIPVNYATAAIPTFAPFGTEYTPNHTMKIIGSRRISIPTSIASGSQHSIATSTQHLDPDLAPTKAIQNAQAFDSSHWQQQSKAKFDTTYRTEFINRIRHPNPNAKTNRYQKSKINQYPVLPPISSKPTTNNNTRNVASGRSALPDPSRSIKDQQVPSNETKPKDIPPLNLNNDPPNFYNQQPPPPPPMNNHEDTYLPDEPVLLTDYEEERLTEQIRSQLANSNTLDRLKLFYQELTAYDPNVTSNVHYSDIQLVASQLGLNLQEDTLRFAMCKFVAPGRGRGYVNYEDMVRYFGKCLSSRNPNQYGPSNSSVNHYPNFYGYHQYECRCRQQHNPYFNHPCPIHHYRP